MNNHYRLMTLHEKVLFRIMPKGYGRASKDVRNFIDELYKELDSSDDYARDLNHRICRLYNEKCEIRDYINDRIEEFKNAGETRKNLGACHYYMLLRNILDMLDGE